MRQNVENLTKPNLVSPHGTVAGKIYAFNCKNYGHVAHLTCKLP
jgi:hypothetical protein